MRGPASLLVAAAGAWVLAHAAPAGSTLADDGGRAPPRAGERLPEDPVLGAKATAQWREHMAREERERKLHYDRDRIKEHRALMRLLAGARARYDRARTPAAVDAVKARLPVTEAEARRRIKGIDHWGNNSNLLADYDFILKALADGYPSARLAALHGDPKPQAELRAELDARDKKMAAWLTEAAASEDE
jgi:hypothetical protein